MLFLIPGLDLQGGKLPVFIVFLCHGKGGCPAPGTVQGNGEVDHGAGDPAADRAQDKETGLDRGADQLFDPLVCPHRSHGLFVNPGGADSEKGDQQDSDQYAAGYWDKDAQGSHGQEPFPVVFKPV